MQNIRYLPLYVPQGVDTPAAALRLCMLNFGDGTTIHTLPVPDASIDQADRQHLLDLACDNLVAAAVAAGTFKPIFRPRRRPGAGR